MTTGELKLIFFEDVNEWEFYDLVNDPKEMNNLIDNPNYKDQIALMKEEWKKQRIDLDVPESEPHPRPRKIKKI